MAKFRFGHLIVGNELASSYYGITTTGSQWVVVTPDNFYGEKDEFGICSVEDFQYYLERKRMNPEVNPPRPDYGVEEKYFDFVRALVHLPNKENVHVLEKYND